MSPETAERLRSLPIRRAAPRSFSKIALLLMSMTAICTGCATDDGNEDRVLRSVACVGDSNTQASNDPTVRVNWCEILAERHPDIDWFNTAIWGATATRAGFGPWCGFDQVNKALGFKPDLIIIALGTNDLVALDLDAKALTTALLSLRDQAEAGGAKGVVALIPPVLFADADLAERIAETNALLLGSKIAAIDFFDDFDPQDFTQPDGIHFTQSGHYKRAAAAESVLFAP